MAAHSKTYHAIEPTTAGLTFARKSTKECTLDNHDEFNFTLIGAKDTYEKLACGTSYQKMGYNSEGEAAFETAFADGSQYQATNMQSDLSGFVMQMDCVEDLVDDDGKFFAVSGVKTVGVLNRMVEEEEDDKASEMSMAFSGEHFGEALSPDDFDDQTEDVTVLASPVEDLKDLKENEFINEEGKVCKVVERNLFYRNISIEPVLVKVVGGGLNLPTVERPLFDVKVYQLKKHLKPLKDCSLLTGEGVDMPFMEQRTIAGRRWFKGFRLSDIE